MTRLEGRRAERVEEIILKIIEFIIIIVLRAGAVSPGDSLEFPAKRHGAGSRCQLREVEEEQEVEV
jgi:hypothetical protein